MTDKCKECCEDVTINHAQVGGVHMSCEWEYFHNKKVPMVKVRPDGCAWAVMTPIEAKSIIDELLDEERGDNFDEQYEFMAVKMTKHEIEVMPEFKGW